MQILPAMNTGGVETGVVDLARSLVRAGHKTIVVSNGGLLVRDLTSAGAKHYQLPVGRKEPLTAWRMTRELVKIIKTEKIDIVHARSRVPGWIAWLACRRTGTKFVTTCHGYYSQHFFSRVMGWGRKVIVASQAIGRHMVEDFKMPYERMSFIPRGVDLEKFKFRPPQEQEPDKEKIYRIGIIGRLTPIKGHPVFIKAIHRLISCDPNLKIKAFIIGEASGDKEDYFLELKKQVKKLGLDDHLEFSGRKSDIPEVLSELDIMVLATTVPEAFGRVIIEAQAVGVPVIAT
ncbi:MAG: glycosyltransferase family 4 protein, partial [Candidatus Omnitrophica bacterium]|nr:glycosyltransferase family 4 protein [Candidatus Omnitrophota bacterium]